jgi:hypothetical protein
MQGVSPAGDGEIMSESLIFCVHPLSQAKFWRGDRQNIAATIKTHATNA